MRINIAASHRFHLLDLAHELEKQGHEVRFYSYVPTKRALRYGLKKECSYSLFFLFLPILLLIKLSKGADWSLKLLSVLIDNYLAFFMKPCDIYIGLGTVYQKSFIRAKKKYNAITILEWGSKHNEEQHRILEEIKEFKKQSTFLKKRAIEGYQLADYISIPSDHVKQSFIERGVPEEKLIQNPYGVDLSQFYPTKLSDEHNYDIITVGGWSYVKGSDLLIDFFKRSNLTLLHVGPIVNLDFPKDMKNIVHVEPVDQKQLVNYYSKAKIFVLPSRAEGLAMVQVQALACGLPIVCSKHTGGRDLRNFLDDKKWIIEMQEETIDELARCIEQALDLASTQTGLRSYSDKIGDQLTWDAYGKRYNDALKKIMHN